MDYLGGGGYEKLVIRQSVIDQVEDGHNDFIETELVDENGQLQMNDWVTTDTLAFETRFSANSQRSSYRTITSTGHDFEGYVDYTLVTDYDNDEDPYQSGRSTETAEATRRQSNVESRVVTVSGWLGREPDRRTVVGGTRSTGKSITTRMVSSDIVTHGFAGDYQHEVDAVQRERKWSRSSSDYGTDSQHGQITSVIARAHAVEFEWSVDSTHSQRTTSSGPDPAEFEFELNTRIYNSTVEFGGPPVGFETTAQLRRSSLEFSIGEDTDGDGVHDQFTGPYTEWFSVHTDTWPEGGVSEGGESSQAEVGSYRPEVGREDETTTESTTAEQIASGGIEIFNQATQFGMGFLEGFFSDGLAGDAKTVWKISNLNAVEMSAYAAMKIIPIYLQYKDMSRSELIGQGSTTLASGAILAKELAELGIKLKKQGGIYELTETDQLRMEAIVGIASEVASILEEEFGELATTRGAGRVVGYITYEIALTAGLSAATAFTSGGASPALAGKLSLSVAKLRKLGPLGIKLADAIQNGRIGKRLADLLDPAIAPNRGKLVFNPTTKSWTSPGGLVYGQGSKHGNRVRHVLDHLVPNASKAKHSVFNVERNKLIGLLDDAWAKRGTGVLQGNRRVFEIDMGRVIGTNGERHIRLVVTDGTTDVITAFPFK